MLNHLKADVYRMTKEKSLVLICVLVLALGVVFTYLLRDESGQNGLFMTISGLVAFLPLFFSSVVNVFWGEDFTYRTINHSLMKSKSRFSIFLYKVWASVFFCLLLVLLNFTAVLVTRLLLGAEVLLSSSLSLFIYQLPFYLCIIMLCIFIFNYMDKIYQAYLVYTVLVLMFDNLVSYIATSFLETDLLNDFLLFNQLKAVTGSGAFFTVPAIIAISFTLVYFAMTYLVFAFREFK